MALSDNIAALALRVGQEIKAVRKQLNGTIIKIGTVTTGAAGSAAKASIGTSVGADGNVSTLNLSIPRGADGPKGDTGPSWAVVKPKMIDVLDSSQGEMGYRAKYEVPFSHDEPITANGYGGYGVSIDPPAPEIQLFTAPGADVRLSYPGMTHNVISGRVVMEINVYFLDRPFAGQELLSVTLPANAAFVPHTYTTAEDQLTVVVARNTVSIHPNEKTRWDALTLPAPLVIPFTISS